MVELHAVDWTTIGLEGFGKPTGYLERQLRRFMGLWELNRTRELPEVEEVGAWLATNLPESPPATVVHGDYRLGNTMFATGAPARLIAILDWEMATIGDPLADVGYMMIHWTRPGDEIGRFNLQAVTTREGFPDRHELIERYEQRSGRPMHALDWYVALALWKAVVFMEGNYKRALAGSTDDPYLKTFGEGVLELARRAWTSPAMASERRYSGLLVDYGGVLTTNLFESFGAFCEEEGIERDAIGRSFREDRAARQLLIDLETGKLRRRSSSRSSPRCSGSAGAPDRSDVRGLGARRADGRGGAQRSPAGCAHRPDLEFVGDAPVRPRAAGRVVRRRRDFGRGRDAQAYA